MITSEEGVVPYYEENDMDLLMQAVDTLKALSNPKRLAILCRLGKGEMSVGEIAGFVGLSQSALSQHLARLREKNLVSTRRQQQTIYYSLSSSETREIIRVLHDLYCNKIDKCNSGSIFCEV